ncbi:MAG: M56 family metallopeptidase [Planctomycetota bacterium]
MTLIHSLVNSDPSVLWVANVLAQVTIVSACVLVLVSFVRKSAVTRWWLLGSALLLTLISPLTAAVSQTFGWGAFQLSASPAATAQTLSAAGAFDVSTQSLPRLVANGLANRPFDPEVPGRPKSTVPSVLAPTSAPNAGFAGTIPTSPDANNATRLSWSAAVKWTLLLVWLGGCLWNLSRLAVGWWQIRGVCQRAVAKSHPEIQQVFAEAWDLVTARPTTPIGARLTRRPTLLLSDEVVGPGATGVFRPVVLLPASLIGRLETAELKGVLRHEIAHVARHDQMIMILQNLVRCMFWIHPLVTLVNRMFAQAREEVCDNFVLQTTTAIEYSTTLLNLAQHARGEAFPVAVGMLDGWRLESRIAAILQADRNTSTRMKTPGVAGVAFVAAGMLVAGVSLTVSAAGDPTESSDSAVVEVDAPFAPVVPQISVPQTLEQPLEQADATLEPVVAAGARSLGEPLPPSTRFTFAGQVVGPDKQPLSGAQVFIARINAKALAISDANGRFEFTRLKSQLPNNAAWGINKLVAVAEGFGIASSPLLPFETSGTGRADLQARNPNKKFDFDDRPPVLTLAKDDVPIQGRIVDLEGQAVSNVNVQPRYVNNTYARFAFDAVTTDQQGRFEIRGVGRDRVVRLVAKGQRTEFSVFFARTKDAPTEIKTTSRPGDPFAAVPRRVESNKVIYGARLTHAVGPSVPVEGRVTDAVTGQPLSNVFLSGDQIGNYEVTPAREELSAVTDQDGRYRFVGLPLGPNRIIAGTKAPGYLSRRVQFDVSEEHAGITSDFTVMKGIILNGRVTDSETGQPIPGFVEYRAAEDNEHFQRGSVTTETSTDASGRYSLNVSPGAGYLAFRTRRAGYLISDVDASAMKEMKPSSPFLPAKPMAFFPVNYNRIQKINLSEGAEAAKQDIRLRRQPFVTVELTDENAQPVNGATVEEFLIVTMGGFARGANRIKVDGSTYRCRQFTPGGSTDVVARHKASGLIGRVSISESFDPDLPVIMANPEDAADVKLARVRINGDSNVTLKMQRAATIRGRVVDKDGNPRVVKISSTERPFQTDDDGRFEFSLVLPRFPFSAQAQHIDSGQRLGMILQDLILKPGEVRDLGDVQVKPNSQ